MTEDNLDNVYFAPSINKRERASFEAGIKLGALYHILCGIPISKDEKVLSSIEKGIESSISCQPYVRNIKINLRREQIFGEKTNEYDYDEITGKLIRAELKIEFKSVKVFAKIDWVKELEYPLMFIERITEK